MTILKITSGPTYHIDASTVDANWETLGFDDSGWSTPSGPPRGSSILDLYDASGIGGGANIGSVAGSDSDAANVFIRFWVPPCVRLVLDGGVDDWIHTLYLNGTSVYTETSQDTHSFSETYTAVDGLDNTTDNLIAVRAVNRNLANQFFFALDTDSIYEGSNWVVGYVSLGQ